MITSPSIEIISILFATHFSSHISGYTSLSLVSHTSFSSGCNIWEQRNLRPSNQRHPLPDRRQLLEVDIHDPELSDGAVLGLPRILALAHHALELRADLTPRVDDHAAPVADAPPARPVVPPDLRGRDDPALGLDGAGPQENLPVRPARRHGERRRVRQQLGGGVAEFGALGQGKRRLGEPQVEADEAADAADGRGERRRKRRPGLGRGGLAQRRVVEQVQLVVAGVLVDVAVLLDPDGAVVELGRVCAGLRRRGEHRVRHGRRAQRLDGHGHVDADVDGDGVPRGGGLQTRHERRGRDRLGERQGLGGRGGDVVRGLGEEEDLERWSEICV